MNVPFLFSKILGNLSAQDGLNDLEIRSGSILGYPHDMDYTFLILSSLLDMPPEVDHTSSPGPRKALILVEVTSEGLRLRKWQESW